MLEGSSGRLASTVTFLSGFAVAELLVDGNSMKSDGQYWLASSPIAFGRDIWLCIANLT